MVQRGRGGIVLVSPMAGLQRSGLVATYAATKAFDTVLAECLWNELTRRGIDVLAAARARPKRPAICALDPMANASRWRRAPWWTRRCCLSRRGTTLVPGRANRMAAFLMTRLLSKRAAIDIMGRATRQMYKR